MAVLYDILFRQFSFRIFDPDRFGRKVGAVVIAVMVGKGNFFSLTVRRDVAGKIGKFRKEMLSLWIEFTENLQKYYKKQVAHYIPKPYNLKEMSRCLYEV